MKKTNSKTVGIFYKLLFLLLVFNAANMQAQLNGYLCFDGANDLVDMGNAPKLNFQYTDSFSIEVMVKLQAIAGGGGTLPIVSKLDSTRKGWSLDMLNGSVAQNPNFRLISDLNTSGITLSANNTINDSNWHHIALTYNGNGQSSGFTFYIDGVITSSQAYNNLGFSSSSSTKNNTNVNLGSYASRNAPDPNYPNNLFKGGIDEVRIWKGVLSPNNILSWHNIELNNTHPDYSNLISYWNLNEGTGTGCMDSVGQNNGSLLNGPLWNCNVNALKTTTYLTQKNSPDYVLYQKGSNLHINSSKSINIIRIVDVSGRIIAQRELNSRSGVIDLDSLYSGVYFTIINFEDSSIKKSKKIQWVKY